MNNREVALQKLRITALTFLIISICFIVAQLVAAIVFSAGGVTDIATLTEPGNNTKGLSVLKIAQFLSSFLSFIIPSFLVALLLYNKPLERLKLNEKVHPAWFLLPIVILFISTPWMNMIIKWNESITFPQNMSGLFHSLQASEQSAKEITEAMLAGTNFASLAINLLLVALLPALGEELLFRGVLQSLIRDLTKNKHVAVLLSAFLFSAIHFQFFGFIPRFILGAFFGYLVVYSGSLWTAICAHLFNNAMAVIVYFYINKGVIQKGAEEFGSKSSDISFSLISFIITALLLLLLFRKFKHEL